jgi:ectoine hydroxylase-related dioxygenase (phytanoyl-CoA dioxygenase family)
MNAGHLIVPLIRSQGYAVVPDLVPQALAKDLRDRVLRLQAEDERSFGKEYLYAIGQEGFVINVGNRGEAFEQLLNARPFAGVVEQLLGPGAHLYLYQGVIVPPGGGKGAYPWKWHCDLYHVSMAVSDPNFIPGINILVYVDDVDSENGATWLVPGSQGLFAGDLEFGDAEFRARSELQVSAPAGSALIFNPLLWHCAGTNNTARHRCAVKMLMVRSWIMPQMDYARSIDAEVLDRLDGGARCLLGHERSIARDFEQLIANGPGF